MRAALIPMKDLPGAKMRLAAVLDAEQRAELALAMLTDVIAACRESALFDQIAVIGRDSNVLWHAREHGAKPIAEPATLDGLNEGLTFGQRYLARRVAVDELLVLPADIPLVRADDVRAAVEALGDSGARAVIVRARDGGTNALAMRPAEAVPMHFGPRSCNAHIAAARDAGVEIVELANERLSFDVDAPEDLEALATAPIAGMLGAATAGWLAARAHFAAGR